MAPPKATKQQGAGPSEQKPQLRQPVFVKIDSLKPETSGHTVVVKVISSNTVVNRASRNPALPGGRNQSLKIAECLVGDETGAILYTARDNQEYCFLKLLCYDLISLSGIDVVSLGNSFDAHTGPQAAEFIKNAVSKWPPLRPLCLILKVFLQQRELNEVYTGGIGSYALLSMLIAMLRNRHDQASLDDNLGVLLVNFFDMYGRKLNTADVGISCNGGSTTFFPKSSKGFSVEGRSSLISIEDPQVPDNDVGKSSFNYYQVRSAFSMAYSTLTNEKVILRRGPKKSILGALIRPDAVLLERKGGLTENATFNTLFPGAGEPLEQLFNIQQEIYCNWRLNDEDEEPLPRGNGIPGQQDIKSSRKKRKSSKNNNSTKEASGSGIQGVDRYEENGSMTGSRKKKKSEENGDLKNARTKKQNWKHHKSYDSSRNSHYGSRP